MEGVANGRNLINAGNLAGIFFIKREYKKYIQTLGLLNLYYTCRIGAPLYIRWLSR